VRRGFGDLEDEAASVDETGEDPFATSPLISTVREADRKRSEPSEPSPAPTTVVGDDRGEAFSPPLPPPGGEGGVRGEFVGGSSGCSSLSE